MNTKLMAIVGTTLVAVLALSGVAWAATNPLALTKTVPKGGATGVAPTVNVQAYFNNDMKASTVNSTTFKIRKKGTTTWLGATRSVNNTISPTSNNGGSQSVATLDPKADLTSNTTYQVVVVGGSSGVKDLNGQVLGTNKSWTFTTVAPPNTTINSGPGGTVASTSASFSFSSSRTGSTFQCSLDGSKFEECTSPQSYSGLGQGSHTFRVRAIASGLTDTSPASRTWTVNTGTVDTEAPETTIDTEPANPSNNASPSFTFSGTDDVTPSANLTFECSLDDPANSAFANCTSPKNLTGLSDGSHTFFVRATDEAGNTDGSAASHIWSVDTAAPTIINVSHVSPPPPATANVTATFSEEMDARASTIRFTLPRACHPLSFWTPTNISKVHAPRNFRNRVFKGKATRASIRLRCIWPE
jgi:Bacterial Ig-like domain